MNAPNFQSILDEAPTEVNRPKPIPAGTYTFVVGPPTYGQSSKKKTPQVEFQLRALAADDDVDQEELEASLTNGEGEATTLDSKTIRLTFYTTPDAIYRLDEFHEHCGLDLSFPQSRRQRNDDVTNRMVRGYVIHRQANPDEPDSPVFADIKRTLPAD